MEGVSCWDGGWRGGLVSGGDGCFLLSPGVEGLEGRLSLSLMEEAFFFLCIACCIMPLFLLSE